MDKDRLLFEQIKQYQEDIESIKSIYSKLDKTELKLFDKIIDKEKIDVVKSVFNDIHRLTDVLNRREDTKEITNLIKFIIIELKNIEKKYLGE